MSYVTEIANDRNGRLTAIRIVFFYACTSATLGIRFDTRLHLKSRLEVKCAHAILRTDPISLLVRH